jgi:hypothetical protein
MSGSARPSSEYVLGYSEQEQKTTLVASRHGPRVDRALFSQCRTRAGGCAFSIWAAAWEMFLCS